MLTEKIEKGGKDIVFVYTTCPSIEEARSIALFAIKEKLAVCGDFWEINSIYPWQGVLQDVFQYMVMLTTEKETADRLVKFVEGLHPYNVPMVAKLDTNFMNSNYKFWVDNILNSKGDYISEHDQKIQKRSDEGNGYHYGKLK